MKTIKIPLITLILVFYSFALEAQIATQIKFPVVKEILSRETDTTYVINFWATWCAPCVEELPGFLRLEKEFKDRKVKFYYISLNFKREIEDQLLPFLKKNEITSTVYLLNEPDYNSWIDKVDATWLGSIPATLIISHKPESRFFQEASFTFEALKQKLTPLIR
jgi:thiol-disulfide isomerase/thioredoxin